MTVNHDQAIFDAIAAATDHNDDGIFISVQKFIKVFNSHRDRKLCTSLDVANSPPVFHTPHNSGERLPSGDAAAAGGEASSGADGVAAYERGFKDGVFVGREGKMKYLVTFESNNGIWCDAPEGFGSLAEAEGYTAEFQTVLLPGNRMVIYSCAFVKTVGRSTSE